MILRLESDPRLNRQNFNFILVLSQSKCRQFVPHAFDLLPIANRLALNPVSGCLVADRQGPGA